MTSKRGLRNEPKRPGGVHQYLPQPHRCAGRVRRARMGAVQAEGSSIALNRVRGTHDSLCWRSGDEHGSVAFGGVEVLSKAALAPHEDGHRPHSMLVHHVSSACAARAPARGTQSEEASANGLGADGARARARTKPGQLTRPPPDLRCRVHSRRQPPKWPPSWIGSTHDFRSCPNSRTHSDNSDHRFYSPHVGDHPIVKIW